MKIYELSDIDGYDDYLGTIIGNLTVIGFTRTQRNGIQYYVQCSICKEDSLLFKSAIFRMSKEKLLSGRRPCGCSKAPRWEHWQYEIILNRVAHEKGFSFVGWEEPFRGKRTPCIFNCSLHGDWRVANTEVAKYSSFFCPKCREVQRDELMIKSFMETEAFDLKTKFWRSDRVDGSGYKNFWFYFCPRCDKITESRYMTMQEGFLSCDCCRYERQKYAYVALVKDGDLDVCLKFGVSVNPISRIKQQGFQTSYSTELLGSWEFIDRETANLAEKECKDKLDCGVIPKQDYPDGFSETTYLYELDNIIKIYEYYGGIKQ